MLHEDITRAQTIELVNTAIADSLGRWLFDNHPDVFKRTVKVLMYGNESYTEVAFKLGTLDNVLKGLLAITHPKLLDWYDLWLEVRNG